VGYFDPADDGKGATRLVISSPPVESVNNRSAVVILGMTVGGGSAVNGQFFDRGSRLDYDEWARLGNTDWDWKNLFPYFQKASVVYQTDVRILSLAARHRPLTIADRAPS